MPCEPISMRLSRMNNQLQLVHSAVMPSTGTEHIFYHFKSGFKHYFCNNLQVISLKVKSIALKNYIFVIKMNA